MENCDISCAKMSEKTILSLKITELGFTRILVLLVRQLGKLVMLSVKGGLSGWSHISVGHSIPLRRQRSQNQQV